VRAPGNSGQLDVTFTPLTEAQRNGSQADEIRYRWSTAYGSGPINAGGGTITNQPNGRTVTVNIIATSIKNNVSGDAKAIGSAVPYGPPGAPAVSGETSPKGDPQVHWTWTAPNNNGRPINRYEVNYDGTGFKSVGLTRQYNHSGGGWGQRHTLAVRACNGTNGIKDCGTADSAASTSGADPTPPLTEVRVKRSDNNSCPGKPGVADRYNAATRSCGGSDANWVSYSDGWIATPCWADIYNNNGRWYLMNGGPHSGWYVKGVTVDVRGPGVGQC
jgi:hypothetical protein